MSERGHARIAAAPDQAPLLSVRNVSKFYGGDDKAAVERALNRATRGELMKEFGTFAAVSNASFDAPEGGIFVIMGLSGSGKSTLIRCINRLIEPTSGKVMLHGEDITAASESRLRELRRSTISMVFQHFALLPHKTVLDNVAFGLKMRGVSRTERTETAMRLLEQVGLKGWESKFPSNLSGGMKQRVGLARSLAVDPSLLLMDEAFSALDPVIRREMQTELVRLQGSLKKTIVFITHDIQEALMIGERIAMMKDGRIVQTGTPADLVLRPQDAFVADFTRDADRARILTASDIMTVAQSADVIRLPGCASRVSIADNGRAIGYTDDAGSGGEPIQTDFPSVLPGARLGTIVEMCRSAAPIVVADAAGNALGAFSRDRLIDALTVKP